MARLKVSVTERDILKAVHELKKRRKRGTVIATCRVCPVAQALNRTLAKSPDYSHASVGGEITLVSKRSHPEMGRESCDIEAPVRVARFIEKFDAWFAWRSGSTTKKTMCPKPLTFTLSRVPDVFRMFA